MRKVKIITDTCADMDKAFRDEYDIDYVRMSLTWAGEEKFASSDWDLYTDKEFYDALRAGVDIKTNQVSVQEFERVFGKYVDEGYDIVYVACSSALSGSCNAGRAVARNIMDAHPECKIVCVDPLTSSGGEAITAIEAARLAAEGLDAETIAEKAIEISRKTFQYCTVDTLSFLKKSGRVKASAAFFGNLFGIKPIFISNAKGENEAVKKIKGRKQAIDACIDAAIASLDEYEDEYPVAERTLYVSHSDCLDDANYIADKLRACGRIKDVRISIIAPIVGTSVGPSLIGIFGIGKQLTTIG